MCCIMREPVMLVNTPFRVKSSTWSARQRTFVHLQGLPQEAQEVRYASGSEAGRRHRLDTRKVRVDTMLS